MGYLTDKQLDEWVKSVRTFEKLLKTELLARKQRHFTPEKMVRDIRREKNNA